jgi:hypothetical protein
MAQAMMCDQHPDRAAAYIVTDLSDGDTFTACGECWVQMCAAVAVAAAAVESDAADHGVQPQDLGEGPANDPAPRSRRKRPESEHRERTRRKLANRPDSAATSLAVVPEPDPPDPARD